MTITATLEHWLILAGSEPLLQAALVVLGTFILEDVTTIMVAILVADGDVPLIAALAGLYGGVILGDLGLYGLGRAASMHDGARKLGEHKRLAPFRLWLDTRLILTVFAVRFIPGLRLPTYTASGFFRLPFRRFALTVIAATTLWTTLLFTLTYYLGAMTAQTLGPWRWLIGLAIAGMLFVVGRANARKFAPPAPADTGADNDVNKRTSEDEERE